MTDLRARWPDVSRKLLSADSLTIIAGLESALAGPDEGDPSASVSASTRVLLGSLSRTKGLTVAVHSEGPMVDLLAQVEIEGIWYVGSGGLEVLYPDGRVTRFYGPEDVRIMDQLHQGLISRAERTAGVRIERSGPSVLMQYRGLDGPGVAKLLEIWRTMVDPLGSQVRTMQGPGIVEARIRCECDERTAMHLIRRESRPGTVAFYLGDNPRVHEALGDYRPASIVAWVGMGAPPTAEFSLPDARAVSEVLNRLGREWPADRSSIPPPTGGGGSYRPEMR